jgi:hypothetical protein
VFGDRDSAYSTALEAVIAKTPIFIRLFDVNWHSRINSFPKQAELILWSQLGAVEVSHASKQVI